MGSSQDSEAMHVFNIRPPWMDEILADNTVSELHVLYRFFFFLNEVSKSSQLQMT